MSTEIWNNPNDPKPIKTNYKIGTMGWETWQKLSQILDSLVPTYGLWAGPGLSGGN